MDHPDKIGKYDVVRFLGGNMSLVYEGIEPVIGKRVTIKILKGEAIADAESKARFLREAQILAGLDHDNILAVYDYGDDRGRPYMVMEFLTGESLSEGIRHGRTGTVQDKTTLALRVARALEYSHGKSVVHRDVKPQNVQVTSEGKIKLMDFGIAKTLDLSLTQTGYLLGTPYYMSPEQVLGRDATSLADIYAFGVLLFELYSGKRPFDTTSMEAIFHRIVHEPLDLEPLKQKGIPSGICDLIASCTAKAPEDRIQSFSQICSRLETASVQQAPSFRQSTTGTAPQETRWQRRALLAALAVSLAGAYYGFVRGPTDPAMDLESILGIPDPASGDTSGLQAEAPPATETTPGPPIADTEGDRESTVAGSQPGSDQDGTTTMAGVGDSGPDRSAAVLPPTVLTPSGPMLLVESGAFVSTEAPGPNVRERLVVDLPAFYIDRTEVSVGAYREYCLAEPSCTMPAELESTSGNEPMTHVSFDEAKRFAVWAGKRLPTMKEWEKAARGTDGREFPWGNAADPLLANVLDNPVSIGRPLRVDSLAEAASPFGVLHMSGNVAEFVDETREPDQTDLDSFAGVDPPLTGDEDWVVIMGGHFGLRLEYARSYEWIAVPGLWKDQYIGFRLAMDPD